MKSFALHLVVVFIVGAQIGTFCSSETPPPVLGLPPAHDRFHANAGPTNSFNKSSSPISGGGGGGGGGALLRRQQTTKTPRTIQRMVAGHLQHPPERRSHIESATVGQGQVIRTSFRTRPPPTRSPPSHLRHNSTILKKIEPNIDEYDDWDDDAALLEDPRDDDNWDNGILRSSAGAGKESNTKGKKKDDSKKTLSDQVKEGKYGLIEKELFQTEPKRPGIISYLGNKDIPGDNAQNLGGLSEDDIWLAEDHLLVLKGGSLNDDDKNEPWEPIDDYEAPNRQIQIPANPKVPPPFPVQFEDNGPIQFIGNNKFPVVYPLSNQSLPLLPGDGYFSPETIGDNEKNLLTGPGSFKNVTSNKGGYFYPPPFPSWLPPNNETFINPFLNFGTPLDGPNGSIDNSTDYIDEDDPSLYYPPPYSFVYKSNYSSPVPPGPLVPGIVLPPPPNAFARLEEPGGKKEHKEIPFRQVLNKIADYGTKSIITTTPTTSTTTTTTQASIQPTYSIPPKEVFYAITRPPKQERTRGYTTTTQIVTNSPTPPPTIRQNIGRLVPKSRRPPPPPPPPQYINFIPNVSSPPPTSPPQQTYIPKVTYSRQQVPDIVNFIPNVPSSTPAPPEVISFIPKASIDSDNLSKGNPIYYEYFDARKTPIDQLHYTQYTTSTQPTVQVQSRPHKKIEITTSQPVQQARLSKNYLPQRPVYNYDDYIYITPKPEIRPNGVSNGYIPILVKPSYKPAQNFEREVDAIRQTLEFYKEQQNYIPRAPKAKAVYEYSFDARPSRDFIPPAQYDDEPFKPMVQYSRPIEDTNGFKAIAYAKSDEASPQSQTNYYPTTTPSVPQQRSRTGGKSYGQVINTTPRQEYTAKPQRNYIERPVQNTQQYTTPRGGPSNVQPWVSIEKQVVQEVEPQSQRQSQRQRVQAGYSRNEPQRSQFNGYYYNPPINNNNRQNDRYYQLDEPLSKHLSAIKAEVQQFQAQLQPPISLENDTYVNYAPNRPPINPQSEFIRSPYPGQQFQQLQKSQAQRLIPSRDQQYQPISLHRDVLVNYRLPLPPINPDSEFVQPQVLNRNQPIYHRPPQYRIPAEPQSGTYYFAPRDVRYRKN